MTMRKILVCNQKGGVGKSLIADELVFSFERSGIPVAFLDLDGPGGTIHKTDRNEDAEVAVVDTPGALQPQLKAWLFDADLIIIPTRTTSRDIEPLCRMKEAVEAAGKSDQTIYVLNSWNRFRASSDFLAWIRGTCGSGVKIYKLPQSEMFVQAGASGVSVVEYSRHSTAAKAVRKLCGGIRKMAGFRPEE